MVKGLFFKITGSQFAKNTILLTGGTILAQLIPIILQPALRRMFTPAEYGTYSIYLSLVGIITIIATFRYDNAIVLPKSDKKAINILGLSVVINLLFNSAMLIAILIFGPQLLSALNIPATSRYVIYLIPAGVFLFCLQQSLNFWLIRKSAFADSSINKITRRAVEGGANISFGYFRFPDGLVFGDVLGGFASCFSGLYHVIRKGFNYKLISGGMIRFVASRYSDFPKFNLLPTLLSAIAFQMPILLINQYYDAKSVGEFDLARQMLNVPLAFIAVTVSQVLLQSLTEKMQRSASIKKQIAGILYVLLAIVAFEISIILLWGPELFGFIFGKVWTESGYISRFLVFNFALNFIMSSFTSIFISFNKLKLYSIWQVSYFLSMTTLLLFNNLSFHSFLQAYVAIDSILILAGLVLITRVVFKYENSIS